MQSALKSLQNNALAALSARAPAGVTSAIQAASTKTGVDFAYLMEKASAESSFNPTAKAKTSSATGLFQFIDSTWMGMVKKHGASHGIDASLDKQSLLELRKDPEIASMMAAEFAKGNKAHLEKTVGGDIGNTELYFAHFMGAGGASAFLNQLKQNPDGIAADTFPKAANANRNVFYDPSTGNARSFSEIYDFFDKKFSDDSDISDNAITSLAHKDTTKTNSLAQRSDAQEGYQHLPPSLKKPIQIIPADNSPSYAGSLYQIQNQLDAFFTQRSAMLPTIGFSDNNYGSLLNPSATLLSILK